MKQEREAQLSSLLADIQRFEALDKHIPSPDTEQELLSLRSHVSDPFTGLKRLYKEVGDTFLNSAINVASNHLSTTYVPRIYCPRGQKVTLPKQIAQYFQDFYSLYNINLESPSQPRIDNYLADSGMPHLPSLVRQELEAPITI